jgi:hypothetical protein
MGVTPLLSRLPKPAMRTPTSHDGFVSICRSSECIEHENIVTNALRSRRVASQVAALKLGGVNDLASGLLRQAAQLARAECTAAGTGQSVGETGLRTALSPCRRTTRRALISNFPALAADSRSKIKQRLMCVVATGAGIKAGCMPNVAGGRDSRRRVALGAVQAVTMQMQ